MLTKNSLPNEVLLNTIADALVNKGYIILQDVFTQEDISSLYMRISTLKNMNTAQIGRGSQKQKIETIRSDKTLWLEGEDESEVVYLDWMKALLQGMNEKLYMGLHDYEAHFAHYEKGSFYKKHSDVLKGNNKRLLTTVFYLTKDWKEEDGGELLMYDAQGKTILETVPPKSNSLVVFLSDKFPHEVLPSHNDRYSIAGWFKGR